MAKKNTQPVADPENDGRVEEVVMTEEIVEAATDELSLSVDYSAYGQEHKAQGIALKAHEVIIPFLKIVQEDSKIFKNQDKNNPICQPGDIYNSTTGEVYKNGVVVVPLDCQDCVIERKAAPDGSFIAKLKTRDPRVQQAFNDNGKEWKQLVSKQKTQFVYTEEVPVGLVDPRNPTNVLGVAIVAFSSTNVFPRRQWWNRMAEVPYAKDTPRYAFRTVLTTVLRKAQQAGGKDSYKFVAKPWVHPKAPQGQQESFYWDVCRIPPNHPTLDRALDFLKLYQTGALGKVDYDQSDAHDEDAAEAAALNDKPAF